MINVARTYLYAKLEEDTYMCLDESITKATVSIDKSYEMIIYQNFQ